MAFIQEPPQLSNQFDSDPILAPYLRDVLPLEHQETIMASLQQLGARTMGDIASAGQDVLAHQPVLQQFDAWGNRVDEIQVAQGWKQLKAIAAEEGLIATGYDRDYGVYSRIFQMAKILLYTPSSAIFTCPLAMTDGATRLLERQDTLPEVFNHLTSRHPGYFWTAGQWMTEKEGGSDVANSSTVAKYVEGKHYRLYGDKWFTSAITSDIAMTLARIEEDGKTTPGNRGLSLFFLRIRDDEGKLNHIRINKLKDKLGTKGLPTAELTLDGTEAIQLGEIGRGVKEITTILNITRIYNAISSVSYMQRGLALAKDYATRREAFGKRLIDLPLHLQTLADLEQLYVENFLLTFYCVELMGRVELHQATDDEQAIQRLLTPLVKLYTGKEVVAFMSEVVESFGGMGYIEETDLPTLFRDAQVFPIWEGTTNVLSLDVLRAIQKESGLEPLLQIISSAVSSYEGELDTSQLEQDLGDFAEYATNFATSDNSLQQMGGRQFAFSLARLVIAYRLLQFSTNDSVGSKLSICFSRLTQKSVLSLLPLDTSYLVDNRSLLDR